MFFREQTASPSLTVDFHFVVVKNLEPYLVQILTCTWSCLKKYRERIIITVGAWSKDSVSVEVCFGAASAWIQIELQLIPGGRAPSGTSI